MRDRKTRYSVMEGSDESFHETVMTFGAVGAALLWGLAAFLLVPQYVLSLGGSLRRLREARAAA